MEKIHNIFPNTNEVEGSYSPFSHVIKLECINQKEFESYKKNTKPTLKQIEVYSIYIHELTHWYGHHSTIWGQNNLIEQYNAMNALLDKDIDELWRVKSFFDSCKRDRFEDYYFDIFLKDYDFETGKWAIETSSSLTFDIHGRVNPKRPINLINYVSPEDESIARIPISTEALLEVRALHHEFNFKINELKRSFKGKKLEHEVSQFNTLVDDLLHSKELLIYNCIAHFTMLKTDQNKLDNIFGTASLVSNFSLNFPKELSSQIKLYPTKVKGQMEHFRQMLLNREQGFLFYNLIMNARDIDFNKDVNGDDILSKSNLPNVSEFKSIALKEMKENLNKLIKGPFYQRAVQRIEKGIQIFEKYEMSSLNYNYMFEVDDTFCPVLEYKDTNPQFQEIPNSSWIDKPKLTFEEHISLYSFMELKFFKFISACKN